MHLVTVYLIIFTLLAYIGLILSRKHTQDKKKSESISTQSYEYRKSEPMKKEAKVRKEVEEGREEFKTEKKKKNTLLELINRQSLVSWPRVFDEENIEKPIDSIRRINVNGLENETANRNLVEPGRGSHKK